MMFVAWPVCEASAMLLTGLEAGRGVVVREQEDQSGHRKSDKRADPEFKYRRHSLSDGERTAMSPIIQLVTG